MKTFFAAIALAAGALAPAFAADVGVSINVVQPGVYGRIDIGNAAPPPVVVQQPIVVAPGRYARERRPIYLYVPQAHQRNWARYCGRYDACGQPVYFVREQWVRDRWAHEHPRGRPDGHDRGRHVGRDRHDDRGRGHDDHGRGDRDDRRGH